MKIRNGFVSNSSSSSFIVGIARVTDLDALNNYMARKRIDLSKFNFIVTTLREIGDNKIYTAASVSGNTETIRVDSFSDSVSIPSKGMGLDDPLLICNISNDEGDDSFWVEDGEYLDYDIDLHWFDKDQQEKYNVFKATDAGIDTKTAQVSYGAARNG